MLVKANVLTKLLAILVNVLNQNTCTKMILDAVRKIIFFNSKIMKNLIYSFIENKMRKNEKPSKFMKNSVVGLASSIFQF